MPKITIISTTIGSVDSAQSIAKLLVEARVAACVQIDGPVESIYRWQGQVCHETEYRLTCKTLPQCSNEALHLLRQLHSYDVPELVVSEVEASQDYFDWLSAQIKS